MPKSKIHLEIASETQDPNFLYQFLGLMHNAEVLKSFEITRAILEIKSKEHGINFVSEALPKLFAINDLKDYKLTQVNPHTNPFHSDPTPSDQS